MRTIQVANNKTKRTKMDKDLQHELEKYKILYTAYADEIKNLWQRSIFLGAFMVLVWSGYGALQLKAFDKDFATTNLTCNPLNLNVYHCASLGLCAIIIILSWLWIAMAKGSKFVQEAHEAQILKHNKLDCLFCDLNKYQKGDYDTQNFKQADKTSFWNPLKSYRYSPSKINIALGWISLIISTMFLYIHLCQTSLQELIQEWFNLIWSFNVVACALAFVVIAGITIHFLIKTKNIKKISWYQRIYIKIKKSAKTKTPQKE